MKWLKEKWEDLKKTTKELVRTLSLKYGTPCGKKKFAVLSLLSIIAFLVVITLSIYSFFVAPLWYTLIFFLPIVIIWGLCALGTYIIYKTNMKLFVENATKIPEE